MAYLGANSYDVEPMRVEVVRGEPRFWMNGKPECGIFTLDELNGAYSTFDELRSAILSGRITIDATRRCACGKWHHETITQ